MKRMKIMHKIDQDLILYELTKIRFVKQTNKGHNEIYIFDYHEAPNLMLEVARLREIAFRKAGGGTGKYLDMDHYDIQRNPYKQLIVWDPDAKEILGGYRFAYVPEVTDHCRYLSNLVFSDYYLFSEKFIKQYLPWSIELGRAFIQPAYQATGMNRHSLYVLDNLFDGLGALIDEYPDTRYFFGKVTMYNHFPGQAKMKLLQFLYNYFGQDDLLAPINPVCFNFPLSRIYQTVIADIETNYNLLARQIRKEGTCIPPMVSAYLKLSPSMKVLGTIHDHEFGDVDETAILITIADMYPHKLERHLTFNRFGTERFIKTAS